MALRALYWSECPLVNWLVANLEVNRPWLPVTDFSSRVAAQKFVCNAVERMKGRSSAVWNVCLVISFEYLCRIASYGTNLQTKKPPA